MLTYIGHQLIRMIAVMIGVAVLVFIIGRIIPGDPVTIMLDVNYTREEYEEMKAYLGLDKPIYVQFGNYLKDISRGNLGESMKSREDVITLITERLPATITLAIAALIMGVIIAIPIGVIAAVKQNTKFDNLAMLAAMIGISTPAFWQGIMLILLFSLYLGWLPSSGRGYPPDLIHLLLPAFTLATHMMALKARLTRSSMLETLREDYIRSARSKGLNEWVVVFRHALKNALIPVVTTIGLTLSRLLGGALVVEVVFAWPGIGRLAYESVLARDYPVVQGVVLMVAGIFVVVNLLMDISYTYIDPRIKYEARVTG